MVKEQVAPKKGQKKTPKIKKSRAIKNSLGQAGYVQGLDARRLVHVPPAVPMGPYTVMRGRTVLTVNTSTSNNLVFLIGPHRLTTVDMAITPCISISGTGVNVPGTTESAQNDALLNNYAGTLASSTANAQLHAMTVVVQCTSTATTASGVMYSGALAQRVGRSNYATWNGVATALLARREVQSTSAYNTMTNPVVITAYPVDMTEWSMQHPVLQTDLVTTSNNYSADTLSQIALVFPQTSTVVEYNLTIYTEWRVNFVDVVLASTSTKQTPTPVSWWNQAINVMGALNGRVEDVLRVGSAVGAIAQKFQGARATLGQLGAISKLL